MHPDNHNKLSKLEYQKHRKTPSTINIIVLDTSASTLADKQLQEAKAVIQSLSEYFYQQRQSIALLCFGNQGFEWLINDAKAPLNMKSHLEGVKAGGGTPLRESLLEVQHYIMRRQRLNSLEKQRLYIITDARSRDCLDDIVLGDLGIESYVFDSEAAEIKLEKAKQLSERLQARYYRLSDL